MPKISVILPVYNGETFLFESINSILNQSFREFELIIINDGSSDKSEEIIKSFEDNRIRYYYQPNKGLAATLNIGIKEAACDFIARQDQDDISLPTRLENQYTFLINNTNYDLVGSWAHIIDRKNRIIGSHLHPISNNSLQFHLLFSNPFVHSSIMIRKRIFECVGYYSEDNKRQPPEDYELWSRIARNSKIFNLPLFLIQYRGCGKARLSHVRKNDFINKGMMISKENINYVFYRNGKEPNRIIYNITELSFAYKVSDFSKIKYIDLYKEIRKTEFLVSNRFNENKFDKLYFMIFNISVFSKFLDFKYNKILVSPIKIFFRVAINSIYQIIKLLNKSYLPVE